MHSSIISEDLIPVDVSVEGSMIRVKFSGGTELSTPVSRFPRLANATTVQRNHWRLIGRGDGIHWPDVDEDISVRTLLRMPKKTPASRVEEIPALIGELLRATQRLNVLFDGRPFTPDGHLVGSIGEVVAEYIYDLDLQRAGTPQAGTSQIDAYTKDGRTVQIKLTGARGTSYGMRWYKGMEAQPADLLVGLQLTDAGFIERYNGPYPMELLRDRPDSRNGQVSLSLNKLRRLNPKTLAHVHSFESINRWFAPVISDVA